MFSKILRRISLCVLALSLTTALILCASIWLARLGPPEGLPKPDKQNLVIDSVNIVDVSDGRILTERQIVIANGVIRDIRVAGAPVPIEFKRINASGAYVVPGLIDMHTHIYDRRDLINSLVYGVTTVRNLRGFPVHVRWKKELNASQWLGTELVTSSPVLDNSNADIIQHALKNKAHARKSVAAFHKAGYDLLKVYNSLPPEILESILIEASKLGMPIAKHGPYRGHPLKDQPFNLENLEGLQSVEHVEEIFQTVLNFDYDERSLSDYLSKLKDSKIPLTPTLATFDHLNKISQGKEDFVADIELHRINPFFKFAIEQTSVNRWLNASNKQADWNKKELEVLLEITKKASDAGISLLVGSDQGTMYMLSGISTHHEMRLMQTAGISTLNILQAATINAAKALELNASLGSVSIGKQADLLLVRQNPLDDIQHLAAPYAVIKAGSWLDEDQLSELSNIGESPSSWLTGFGYLIEDLILRKFI